MGTIVRLSLLVMYFVVLTSRLHQKTEAFSLTNMFMSGNKQKITTTTSKPLVDDYEIEDLEDDDADEADGENDGNSGLLAMLNPYISLRKPNRPTNGHSKPELHKPDIIAPHIHYGGKPTFIVTKTLVHEVTRRVTVHPVCVTADSNKSPCISDDDQHHTPSNSDEDLKDYKNNYKNLETEYLLSEPEYAADYDSAYLQPSEFSIYDLSDTYKEDIIDSRAARYLKMYTQTPSFINKHPIIISDQIDEHAGEDTEKWLHLAAKKTVTKTILVTKIQRVPNLQVTATLVAQNCIPASYLSHPWCKDNPHRATSHIQEDDAFEPDLDIRKNDEGLIEEIYLSEDRNDVKSVSASKETQSDDVNLDSKLQQGMTMETFLSKLVPDTILRKKDILWPKNEDDVINITTFNPIVLLKENDEAFKTVLQEHNINTEELIKTQNMDGDEDISKIIDRNLTNIDVTENFESKSGNLNENDKVYDVQYDLYSLETTTENTGQKEEYFYIGNT